MRHIEKMGIAVATGLLAAGCGNEQVNAQPDDQPRTTCEVRRDGTSIQVVLKLGAIASSERQPNALAVMNIEGMAPQSEPINRQDVVVFDNLPPQAVVSSAEVRSLGADDPDSVNCDVSSVNGGNRFEPGLLPRSGA